jgi:hypothetical protein
LLGFLIFGGRILGTRKNFGHAVLGSAVKEIGGELESASEGSLHVPMRLKKSSKY